MREGCQVIVLMAILSAVVSGCLCDTSRGPNYGVGDVIHTPEQGLQRIREISGVGSRPGKPQYLFEPLLGTE